MNKETYEISRDEAQALNIERLVRHSSDLTTQLRLARKQIGEQRGDIARLRDGKLALRLELAEATGEIGRLLAALTYDPESDDAPPAGK